MQDKTRRISITYNFVNILRILLIKLNLMLNKGRDLKYDVNRNYV